MKKLILYSIFIFLVKTTFAQNLVPNGSFETMNVCPSAYNQVTACATWSPAPNNINAAYGTEYLNACNGGLFNVPNSTWGPQAAKTGNGYMATCMMAPAVAVDYRENIYTQLSSALIPGNTYSVSMYVSHTDNSQKATNNIGLKFSKVQSFPINNIAHVWTSSIITDNINWILISGSFVADSAYQYLAVGNFFTDANTTATVSCSGCAFSQYGYFIEDVSVVPLNPVASFVTSSQTVCAGVPVSFTNTSSNATTYNWGFGDGATSTSTNTTHTFTNSSVYTVTLTSMSGTVTSTSTKAITVYPSPTINVISTPTLLCSGQAATLTASGAFTYSWSTGSNSQNIVVSPTVSTTYTINATDIYGCSNTNTYHLNVADCTFAKELTTNDVFTNVYPNPNSGEFNMKLINTTVVKIYDALGNEVFNKTLEGGTQKIQLQNIRTGMYFVRVISTNNNESTSKIIIN